MREISHHMRVNIITYEALKGISTSASPRASPWGTVVLDNRWIELSQHQGVPAIIVEGWMLIFSMKLLALFVQEQPKHEKIPPKSIILMKIKVVWDTVPKPGPFGGHVPGLIRWKTIHDSEETVPYFMHPLPILLRRYTKPTPTASEGRYFSFHAPCVSWQIVQNHETLSPSRGAHSSYATRAQSCFLYEPLIIAMAFVCVECFQQKPQMSDPQINFGLSGITHTIRGKPKYL